MQIKGKQLDRLAERVLSVDYCDLTRTFELREECDGYYRKTFTPEDLIELGTELVAAGAAALGVQKARRQ
jgi:hypothetical protein